MTHYALPYHFNHRVCPVHISHEIFSRTFSRTSVFIQRYPFITDEHFIIRTLQRCKHSHHCILRRQSQQYWKKLRHLAVRLPTDLFRITPTFPDWYFARCSAMTTRVIVVSLIRTHLCYKIIEKLGELLVVPALAV